MVTRCAGAALAAWVTLLACAAQAEELAEERAGERAGERLTILSWQAPSTLNPYLSAGAKDVEAASLVLEPLARFTPEGQLVAWLADEIPTLENGGRSADMMAITWRLREGLLWSDGSAVTSEDVRFTWAYCTAEGAGCAQAAKFDGIAGIETPDARTITIRFNAPQPNPYAAFVGAQTPILQGAQFARCMGAQSATCSTENFAPIGTGPFTVAEFRPNDVIRFAANPQYRDPALPGFAEVVLKGGGDAPGAARAVFQTAEADYATNLQLAPELLERMAQGGRGEIETAFGPLVEYIALNLTDPDPRHGAARATPAHPHPVLSDPVVRRALSLALDRAALVEIGYGTAGRATCNIVVAPAHVASTANEACHMQDIETARELLDQAGWRDSDGDGIRDKDGRALSLSFQTSTNAVRQDFQAIIKHWWAQIGVGAELRNINASVFFGSDPASPDTFQKFHADAQMFASMFDGTDPETFLRNWRCDRIPGPDNGWQGSNVPRFCDSDYDRLTEELARTGAPDERARLVRALNDRLVQDHVLVPLVARGRVSGRAKGLEGVEMNPWDSEFWNIAQWRRQAE